MDWPVLGLAVGTAVSAVADVNNAVVKVPFEMTISVGVCRCICCSSILSLVQFLFSFVLFSVNI